MRGTFARWHGSLVSRHAASSGSAEFLLPSTITRPDSRRPPSIRRIAILPRPLPVAEIDNFLLQGDAKPIADCVAAPGDERTDLPGRRSSLVHNEVRVRGGHDRAALARALET